MDQNYQLSRVQKDSTYYPAPTWVRLSDVDNRMMAAWAKQARIRELHDGRINGNES